MEALDWDYMNDLALKVAREIGSKWPIVEVDDVHQEIMLHLVVQQDLVSQRAGDEESLRRICWRAGKKYASKERNHFDLVDDQYYYTPEEARGALRSFIYTDDEIGNMIGLKDDLTRCRISDNILSARSDASLAIKKLTPKYQDVLMRVFVYGLPPRDKSEARTSYRASDALAVAMNSIVRRKNLIA